RPYRVCSGHYAHGPAVPSAEREGSRSPGRPGQPLRHVTSEARAPEGTKARWRGRTSILLAPAGIRVCGQYRRPWRMQWRSAGWGCRAPRVRAHRPAITRMPAGWTAVGARDDHVPMGTLPAQSRARVRAYALWLIAALLL